MIKLNPSPLAQMLLTILVLTMPLSTPLQAGLNDTGVIAFDLVEIIAIVNESEGVQHYAAITVASNQILPEGRRLLINVEDLDEMSLEVATRGQSGLLRYHHYFYLEPLQEPDYFYRLYDGSTVVLRALKVRSHNLR